MKEAIQKAIEGGWKGLEWNGVMDEARPEVVLDPSFWQCLGKALGWDDKETVEVRGKELSVRKLKTKNWLIHWHLFIDHLAEGKEVEEFFSNLTKSND